MQGVWTSCALQGTNEEVNCQNSCLNLLLLFFFFSGCGERERRGKRVGNFFFTKKNYCYHLGAEFLIDEMLIFIF